MYNVSNKYLSAIENSVRKSTVTGYISLLGSTDPFRIDDSNILKDTLYVTNRCVNNSKLEFGAVYAGECGFTLIADIDRYKLVTPKYHARIKLDYNIIFDDGTTETVPLGVFFVDSATRTGKLLKITAIDEMSNLDEECTDNILGDFKTLVKYISDVCNLELAQTNEELDALHVNAAETFAIRPEQVDTYRDAVSYLASVVCCFATIDRNGKLKFTSFTQDIADINTESSRLLGCSFEDYEVKYNGVKCRFFANENFYPYKSKKSNNKDALVLDLGDIPIVGGTEKEKQKILDNICNTVVNITYTPAQLYIPPNPAYDLGDLITCDNINGTDNTVQSYIMEYKFEYRKKETLKCFGENPRLQGIKDKSQKSSSSTESQIESKSVVVVTGKNTDEIAVTDESCILCDIKYSATADCKPIIMASIEWEQDLDGIVKFELYDLMTPIEDAVFTGYYTAGKHVQTLMYVQNAKQDARFTIRLLAKCYADTSSKVRAQDAEIVTLKNAFAALSATPVTDLLCWDASQWRQGYKDATTSTDVTTCIRNNCYIPIMPSTKYKIIPTEEAEYQINATLYNGKHAALKEAFADWVQAESHFTTPGDAAYIIFRISRVDGADVDTSVLNKVKFRCMPAVSYNTVAVDDTPPQCSIAVGAARLVAYAQGIDGGTSWDGTLEFSENISSIEIASIDVATFTDVVATKFIAPTPVAHTEKMDAIEISCVDIQTFSAYVNDEYVVKDAVIDANCQDLVYNAKYVDMSSGKIALKQSYTFTSVIDTIDSGKLAVLSIDLSQFNSVESVVIE